MLPRLRTLSLCLALSAKSVPCGLMYPRFRLVPPMLMVDWRLLLTPGSEDCLDG